MPLRRFLPPSRLFVEYRKSAIPAGGWTHEAFQSSEGVLLVKDLVAAQKAAKLKGSRLLTAPLTKLMRGQVEAVIDLFHRRLTTAGFASGQWVQGTKATTITIEVAQHGELWTKAIEEAFAQAGAHVTATVKPALQSVADDVLDKTTALLSGRKPSAAAAHTMRTQVNQLALEVAAINDTTRTRLQRFLAKEIDAGTPPFAVMEKMRKRIPEIATNRVPTIVRTELGRAADRAAIRGMRDSEVVTHVSVIGCEAIEPGIPTWNGIPTCNIKNVPIASAGDLRFHPNHTGAIVASGFRQESGQTPPLKPGTSSPGIGTFEDRGRPVPALVQDRPAPATPPTLPTAAPPQGPVVPPEKPVAPQQLVGDPEHAIQQLMRRPQGSMRTGWRPPTDAQGIIALHDELRAAGVEFDFMDASGVAHSFGGAVPPTEISEAIKAVHGASKFLGMSPVEFRDRILAGVDLTPFTGGARVAAVYDDFEKSLSFSLKLSAAQGDVVALRTVRPDPDTGSLFATHSQLTVPAALQGSGIGKQLSAAMLRLYDHLGVTDIELTANIDVGGYAWAKYGFVPASTTDWQSLMAGIKSRWENGLRQLATTQLDPVKVANIDSILSALSASTDPSDILVVANLRDEIAVGGVGQPLGKRFLLGTLWHGRLDLRDPLAYSNFRKVIE